MSDKFNIRALVWSLVALLILLIAAAIIPSCFQSKIVANEASAIGTMRKIKDGEKSYRQFNKNKSLNLADLINQKYLDVDMESDIHWGYKFSINIIGDNYTVDAVPVEYPKTGIRSFHMDEESFVHAGDKKGDRATKNDPELGSVKRSSQQTESK